MDKLSIEIYERDTLGELVNILIKNGYTVIDIKKDFKQATNWRGVNYIKNFYTVIAGEQEDE